MSLPLRTAAQSYLADCEATIGGDIAAARAVWEDAVKARSGNTSLSCTRSIRYPPPSHGFVKLRSSAGIVRANETAEPTA